VRGFKSDETPAKHELSMSVDQASEYRNRDEMLTDIRGGYDELDSYYRKIMEEPYDPFLGYIATPIFTTRVFLRSIPEGAQRFDYNEGHCRYLLAATNSHFFGSIHMHSEAALRLLCTVKQTRVTSSKFRQAEKLAEAHPALKKGILMLAPKHPEFADYLTAALKSMSIDKDRQRHSREWFDAISVLRNKSAHSDARVTLSDKRKLAQVNLQRWVFGEKILLSPRLYAPTFRFMVEFFKHCKDRLSLRELGAAHFDH
jgi:hypothetical protein